MIAHSHHPTPIPSINLCFPSRPPRLLAIPRTPRKLPLLLSSPIDDFLSPAAADTELELRSKPSPLPQSPDPAPRDPPDLDEALAPFLKLFTDDSPSPAPSPSPSPETHARCYDPSPGDLVVGVVVSGNENRMDVNIGADSLATMLTKEVLPLYSGEMEHVMCDLEGEGGMGGDGAPLRHLTGPNHLISPIPVAGDDSAVARRSTEERRWPRIESYNFGCSTSSFTAPAPSLPPPPLPPPLLHHIRCSFLAEE